MKEKKHIYFLEWVYENYNITKEMFLNECLHKNCGWSQQTKAEIVEILNNPSRCKIICDSLFDWIKWDKKYGDQFPIQEIHNNWIKTCNESNNICQTSRTFIRQKDLETPLRTPFKLNFD